MPIYVGVSSANRQVKTVPVGVSGANRNCKSVWAGVSGVNRQVFAAANMSNVVNISAAPSSGTTTGGNFSISCSGSTISIMSNLAFGYNSGPYIGIQANYNTVFSAGDHTVQVKISNFTYTLNGGKSTNSWLWPQVMFGDYRYYDQSYDPNCEAIADAGGVFTYSFTATASEQTNLLSFRFRHTGNNAGTKIQFTVEDGAFTIDGEPIQYPDFSYSLTYE